MPCQQVAVKRLYSHRRQSEHSVYLCVVYFVALLLFVFCVLVYYSWVYFYFMYIQGVPGGMDKTSGVFLMLNYTDITQNTYIQS